jgi:hypothetical protein
VRKSRRSTHHGGIRGVYLVAAELSRLGYGVAPTARNAAEADLLIFAAESAQARSIDVKTNSTGANFWLVGKSARRAWSRTHFYVLLKISSTKDGGEVFKYYVVPSKVMAQKTVREGSWYSFSQKTAEPYRDKWSLLGSP